MSAVQAEMESAKFPIYSLFMNQCNTAVEPRIEQTGCMHALLKGLTFTLITLAVIIGLIIMINVEQSDLTHNSAECVRNRRTELAIRKAAARLAVSLQAFNKLHSEQLPTANISSPTHSLLIAYQESEVVMSSEAEINTNIPKSTLTRLLTGTRFFFFKDKEHCVVRWSGRKQQRSFVCAFCSSELFFSLVRNARQLYLVAAVSKQLFTTAW
ncbi:uncharacterized protein V6R79_021755 [Siganus canaliculatus]